MEQNKENLLQLYHFRIESWEMQIADFNKWEITKSEGVLEHYAILFQILISNLEMKMKICKQVHLSNWNVKTTYLFAKAQWAHRLNQITKLKILALLARTYTVHYN